MDLDKIIECKRCNENVDIHSKFASFDEMVWHEQCFYCDGCSSNLDSIAFSYHNKQELICRDCYKTKYASQCFKCNELIELGQETFRYGDKKWHRECFVCSECKENLNPISFWQHNNDTLCKNCYGEKYTQSCNKCKEKIWKYGITYRDMNLHSDCFICEDCSRNLVDQKFFCRNDSYYCFECFQKKFCDKCHQCNEYITGITGDKVVCSDGLKWHTECFYCVKCKTSLVQNSFVMKDREIMCQDCQDAAS